MKRLYTTLLLLLLSVTGAVAASTGCCIPAVVHPWGVAYFHGWMTKNNITDVLTVDRIHFDYGTLDTLELSYQLNPQNWFRRVLQPIVSTVEVAANTTYRADPRGDIYEFDPYVVLRWQHFPWDRYLLNSFAFGDGLSYVTKPPERELVDSTTHNPKRLLNFLMLEITFAMPSHPQWELVTRVHHRCGAWGAFGAGNLSSNAIDLGLRYRF